MTQPRATSSIPVPLAPDADAYLAWAFAHLHAGVSDREHPFHAPTLATLTPVDQGSLPTVDARVVTLRVVNERSARLMAHVDIRTATARAVGFGDALDAGRPVAWLFYNQPERIQVRVRGVASVETTGPLVDERWAKTALYSRRCYLAPIAPGSPIAPGTVNLPPELRGRRPTLEESEAGRANFGVIVCRIQSLGVLHLASDGHRRCEFDVSPGTGGEIAQWRGRWVGA